MASIRWPKAKMMTSTNSLQAFVIGYDISNPRRLQRIHREMCKHAAPLEYSIFLLVGSEADKDAAWTRLPS
jgi:hypothetical protein